MDGLVAPVEHDIGATEEGNAESRSTVGSSSTLDTQVADTSVGPDEVREGDADNRAAKGKVDRSLSNFAAVDLNSIVCSLGS